MFRNTGLVIRWTLGILDRFFRVSRHTTWAAIASLTAARITRMLAFLLPLKVILLAGSDGVPHYFRFLFSPEGKELGIMALSAAAVAAYTFTVFLEARPRQLSERASDALLAASGVMAVVAGQREQMQGFYARFMQVAAGMLFAAAALAALVALTPAVALFLAGLLGAFYLLTAWALHGVTPLRRNRLSDLITGQLGNYLGILSSVAFLSSFLVILYPLLTGADGSILVAIIAFVLVRQLLTAVSASVKDVVALAGQRPLIDALVFPSRQFRPVEARDGRTLRELFGRHERERLVARELARLAQPGQKFRVEWRDPLLPGAADFAVVLEGGDAPAMHFRQRVFPPRLRHVVENEDLLFSHVERNAVWAPPLAGRFFHGEYECILWETGTGRAPAGKQWRTVEGDFLANLWSFEPPPALLKIYASSHSFLHQRLTDEFVSRMDIGVDNDADVLNRFRAALPAICDLLAGMPLRLVNSDFRRENVVAASDGGFHVLGWERWSLEPVGAGTWATPATAEDRLAVLLKLARARRPAAIPDLVGVQHLMLAQRCSLLERAILRGTMKAALAQAERIAADLDALKRMPVPAVRAVPL